MLTARWTELLLLNFRVPVEVIQQMAPPGTEADEHERRAYVSVVGFRFHAVRLLGLPVPGHTDFPEINLRYYVRRRVNDEVRRGVVFVREIAPRRAVAFTANWLYNENYVTRRMRRTVSMRGAALDAGDTLEYAWRSGNRWPKAGQPALRWNRLACQVASSFVVPTPGSLEEFIIEHYWGYASGRDRITREYEVAHEPWRVAEAKDVVWDCDLSATYNTPLAEYLREPPAHVMVAAGSAVRVFRGSRMVDDRVR